MTRVGRRPIVWVLAGAMWLTAVAVGLRFLMQYDNQPGLAAEAPPTWPAGTPLSLDAAGPTLVMLAHPRCDCTRASLAELEELLARADPRPRTYVVFIRPGGVAAEWERTSLWRTAAGIAGVTVYADERGTESRRFGVETSGQVLVYGVEGRLLYSGGTTGSRGKIGNNAGRAAILAALAGRDRQSTEPVFGCSLFDPTDELAQSLPAHDTHTR